MEYPKYQQKIIEKLYSICINNTDHIISLSGSLGCGKTSIAKGLVEKLVENWRIYSFEGIDKTMGPYQTLYIKNQFKSSKEIKLNFSAGLEFIPLVFSVSPCIESHSNSFNKNEEAILRCLKRDLKTYQYLLIIADNYDQWDQYSKEFLIKLSKYEKIRKQLKILIINTDTSFQGFEIDFNLEVNSFTISDYKDICETLKLTTQFDITKKEVETEVLSCVKDNIDVLRLYCEYMENANRNSFDIESALGNRIKTCSSTEQDCINNIPQLTIIDEPFNLYDAAYSEEKSEKKYADVINVAKNNLFIDGEVNFRFSSELISGFFKKQLLAKEALLHIDFALYLNKNRPEDYCARAKHLLASNNQEYFEEAYYLSAIEQARRSPVQKDMGYFNKLLDKYSDYYDVFFMKANTLDYKKGMEAFYENNYEEAIENFSNILLVTTPYVFHAEVLRNYLMSLVLLANDYSKIEKMSIELFELIEKNDFSEREQWVRAALLLMSIYIDRIYDEIRFKILWNKMIDILVNSRSNHFICLIDWHIKRRAAIFYNPLSALRCSESAANHFHAQYEVEEEYKASCNFAANSLICAEYTKANKALENCVNLVNNNALNNFPSFYKIENNLILVKFLLASEQNINKEFLDENLVIESACVAIETIDKITLSNNEVSHVVTLNKISFLLLTSQFILAEEMIKILSSKVRSDDLYYNYYLSNMKVAYHYFINERSIAIEILKQMTLIKIPLMQNNQLVFDKRIEVLKEIINSETQIKLTPFEYNYRFISKLKVENQSWFFFGRGLLLSDLQFLSL